MIENHLQSAAQRVAAGQRLLDRQHALVAALEAHGHATGTARKLLTQFEALQTMRIAARDRLVEELARRAD
ncbi:MAG: hypothetical protein HYX38_00985 [Rhodospirillales bacterium]|nr:hypothetical protein [Rhodospirillales bacterium]